MTNNLRERFEQFVKDRHLNISKDAIDKMFNINNEEKYA